MAEDDEDQYLDGEMEMQSLPDAADSSRRRQLMLVYLVVLAEA